LDLNKTYVTKIYGTTNIKSINDTHLRSCVMSLAWKFQQPGSVLHNLNNAAGYKWTLKLMIMCTEYKDATHTHTAKEVSFLYDPHQFLKEVSWTAEFHY
jgi:hypothetical protein